MRYLLLLFIPGLVCAQKPAQIKREIKSLQQHIQFLADDKLEGRRTGMTGEKLAADYIVKQFIQVGLADYGNNYIQPFEVRDGKSVKQYNLSIGNIAYNKSDYYPLSWSSSEKITVNKEDIGFINVTALKKDNVNNPHFDIIPELYERIFDCRKRNNKAVVVYARSPADSVSFNPKEKLPSFNAPVLFVKDVSIIDALQETKESITIEVLITDNIRTGHNVIGHIDNKASNTIVIGAHYDHLGYGEDHTSLYTGNTPIIHNGADDNASGTAALLLLAQRIKKSGLKNYNYCFVAFSGEELGLFGSKYFTEHAPFDVKSINYMINMDMVGRLNDSTHALTVGGFGTSPQWASLIDVKNNHFLIKIDSSGIGPSDHTSFYKKDIPVLFIFTGVHKDYHKPGDDADKINFSGAQKIIHYLFDIICKTNEQPRLVFTKTRETATARSSFKVTLGIMPDYTYSGRGVLAEGVTEGRPAAKAGILPGDVITQLGEYSFSDVNSYMQALGKFEKGQTTKVHVMRNGIEIILNIEL